MIGMTHLDNYKITSNFILATSNILESHIYNASNTLESHIYNTSNILESHISNAKNYNINYTNILRNDVNKWINEEVEHKTTPVILDLTHTYMYNNNIGGEIRFKTRAKLDYPAGFIDVDPPNLDYKVKIDTDGKLRLYYTYNPLINATWFSGWIEPMDIIIGLVADSLNQGTTISGMEIQIAGNGEGITGLYGQYFIMDGRLVEVETHVIAIENYLNGQETLGSVPAQEAQNINDWGSETSLIQSPQQATQQLEVLNTTVNTSVAVERTNRIADFGNTLTLAITQNPVISAFLGYGFAGVSVVYGLLQNGSLHQYYNYTLENAIKNNSNLSASTITELTNLNQNTFVARNLIDMCQNYYQLGIIQGFINSNITTAQTIPSISTSSIYLNNGNINGVSSINASTGTFGGVSTTNNNSVGSPTIGNFGGNGDKIIFVKLSLFDWNKYR